jgi:hypothetical protein
MQIPHFVRDDNFVIEILEGATAASAEAASGEASA